MQEKAQEEMDLLILKYKRKRRLKRREPRLLKTLRTSKFNIMKVSRKEWKQGL